jgi:hypothetical protein
MRELSTRRENPMSSAVDAADVHITAHIRRLSAEGSVLYIRIDNPDIARLRLRHGQAVEIRLGRARVGGIIKTSGGSPWLAPEPGVLSASITAISRQAGFEHGMDVTATVKMRSSERVFPSEALRSFLDCATFNRARDVRDVGRDLRTRREQ